MRNPPPGSEAGSVRLLFGGPLGARKQPLVGFITLPLQPLWSPEPCLSAASAIEMERWTVKALLARADGSWTPGGAPGMGQ